MADSSSEMFVYKQLSADMRDGLRNIYQQLATASSEGDGASHAEALFTEASDQLDEVVRATESAAMSIMEIVERQLERTEETSAILARLQTRLGDDEDLDRLVAMNGKLGQDLTNVLTALSFQDITGQRIKKVMTALAAMERNVLELYLSSGLVMEGAAKDPAKDVKTLKAEARQAMDDFRANAGSELKGPDKNGVSQAAIDDMLAQLGL